MGARYSPQFGSPRHRSCSSQFGLRLVTPMCTGVTTASVLQNTTPRKPRRKLDGINVSRAIYVHGSQSRVKLRCCQLDIPSPLAHSIQQHAVCVRLIMQEKPRPSQHRHWQPTVAIHSGKLNSHVPKLAKAPSLQLIAANAPGVVTICPREIAQHSLLAMV